LNLAKPFAVHHDHLFRCRERETLREAEEQQTEEIEQGRMAKVLLSSLQYVTLEALPVNHYESPRWWLRHQRLFRLVHYW